MKLLLLCSILFYILNFLISCQRLKVPMGVCVCVCDDMVVNTINPQCPSVIYFALGLQVPATNDLHPASKIKFTFTYSHAYIRSQMESLTEAKDPRKPPSGPLLSWFVMLLVPAVSLVNIVFTGYLFRGYSGLVVTILTVILFSYIIKQNHRLPHMSRSVEINKHQTF